MPCAQHAAASDMLLQVYGKGIAECRALAFDGSLAIHVTVGPKQSGGIMSFSANVGVTYSIILAAVLGNRFRSHNLMTASHNEQICSWPPDLVRLLNLLERHLDTR